MAPTSGKKVSMENTDGSPTRFLLKIESFSSLSGNGIDKYESSEFQSNGYKWKMIIYPNGDEAGKDHMSVFLAISGASSLHAGWEVHATFNFLIFDQIRNNFLVMKGMEQRFLNITTQCGFSECIPLATFKEPSNGYLFDDKCIFGVDVYVIKNQAVGECMSLLNDIKPYKHEWKVSEFSKLKGKQYSKEFTVGGYKWKLYLHPTGNSLQNAKSISIYLESENAKGFDVRKKVLAKFSIFVKDQITGAHHKKTGGLHWFSAAEDSWGWGAFMPLSEFKDPMKGFLVKDCCTVEADVSVLRVVDGFT